MDTAIYVNLSTQTAVKREIEIVANNLANMTTAGFRAERTLFDDALRKTGGGEPISFVIDRASYTDYRPGGLTQTDNPLDIAINGKGFFQVETEQGVRYTRDGRLTLTPFGDLSAIDGSAILSVDGTPIQIPPEAARIEIADDGTINADGVDIARIGLYEFGNEQVLVREADGRFSAPVDPVPSARSTIKQGMVEGSNVDPIREITRLITLSRAYEQSSKMASDVHGQKKDAVKRLGETR